jgi:hypothetical protein
MTTNKMTTNEEITKKLEQVVSKYEQSILEIFQSYIIKLKDSLTKEEMDSFINDIIDKMYIAGYEDLQKPISELVYNAYNL